MRATQRAARIALAVILLLSLGIGALSFRSLSRLGEARSRVTEPSMAEPLREMERTLSAVFAACIGGVVLSVACAYAVEREGAGRARAETARQRLFDLSHDMMSIKWPDGVRETNAAWRNVLGYPIEEARRKPLGEIVHPDELPAIAEMMSRARSGDTVGPFDNRFRTKSGEYRWIAWSVVVDQGGALYSTLRDVTESRQHAERLEELTRSLARSNRELQEFATVASHDLQEPLRKIRTFGDKLQAKATGLDDQGRDYLTRMQSAAERMQRLIEDLLSFSRVAGRPPQFQQVDLAAIAREVSADLEARVAETSAKMEIGALPSIKADPTQMRQLLQNLIGNALKFHKPGSPPIVRVSATTREAPATVVLEVADQGIGFDEKYLDRIFAVFQRLHSRSEYEGTGMGLAICRRIAERHRGSITARSKPGEGATFVTTLPVDQPETLPSEAPA